MSNKTVLNDKTDKTKENLHLMVTPLCYRNCKYCCNKFYKIEDIPHASRQDFLDAKNVYLTGGEPFAFAQPTAIAWHLRDLYPNIKKIIVYTNAKELGDYLRNHEYASLAALDGLSVSIKDETDAYYFTNYVAHDKRVVNLTSNRLYVFDGIDIRDTSNFQVFEREWQTVFQPATDSIFRKL